MEQYFQDAKPNQVVAILKAREPARILLVDSCPGMEPPAGIEPATC
jgi:hypothetical protein